MLLTQLVKAKCTKKSIFPGAPTKKKEILLKLNSSHYFSFVNIAHKFAQF